MSRIGKKIITLPDQTSLETKEGLVWVKGPKGDLSFRLPLGVTISSDGRAVSIDVSDKTNPVWGTARSIIESMVRGVSEGYEKKLEMEGVGFKAQLQGGKLILNVGFSHPVEYQVPAGVGLKVEKNTITVSGADKFLVGEAAANIRNIKKPEPYKGKGIRYAGEVIRRKAGKKATAAGG